MCRSYLGKLSKNVTRITNPSFMSNFCIPKNIVYTEVIHIEFLK